MTTRPRRLLALVFLLAPAWAAGPARGDGVPWFKRALVGMEVGPTGAQFGSDPSDVGYAADFDGREVVRRCAEAGSDYVVIWARDGEYAYYYSKVVAKCPGLGARDVLREAVEEGKARKLPIIAYCVVQQGGGYLTAHPELAMRGPDGAIIPGRFCLNSGYLETLKALTSEMLAYGIDGFHIDDERYRALVTNLSSLTAGSRLLAPLVGKPHSIAIGSSGRLRSPARLTTKP